MNLRYLLAVVPVVLACGAPPTPAAGPSDKGKAPAKATAGWKGSWWGAGNGDTVEAFDKDSIPIQAGESAKVDTKSLAGAVVVFQDSKPDSGDSLRLSWTSTGGWVSACIAAGDPWGWAPKDVSKANAFMISIKGEAGGEDFLGKLKFDGKDGKEVEGIEIDIAQLLPAKKVTTTWQTAIVALEMSVDPAKVDLGKFKSICGGFVGAKGKSTVLIDNVVFFEAKPSDLDQKAIGEAKARIAKAAKATVDNASRAALAADILKTKDKLFKSTLFDFEMTPGNFGDGNHEKPATTGFGLAPVDKLPAKDREGHGKNVLSIGLALKASPFAQALVSEQLGEADWTDVRIVDFDVYVPSGGPDTLAVTPIFQSSEWKNWSQDPAQVPVPPATWTRISSVVPSLPDIDTKRMSTMGMFIWGKLAKDYKGPVYVDNVVLYATRQLDAKPVLESLKIKETVKKEITVDASLSGGKVGDNLISINGGANLASNETARKLMKELGPGGFLRTWGSVIPGTKMVPAKGKYDWSEPDAMIKAIQGAGWKPMVTMGTSPDWMSQKGPDGKATGVPTDPNEWAAMAADIVKHYNKDLRLGIKHWEIWNEPDLEMFWKGTEKQYVELVKAASDAMKKVDPSIVILGGAWANSWAPTTSRLKNMLALRPSIDRVSYHNYLTGEANATEEQIWKKTPKGISGPAYKNKKAIESVVKELGLEKQYAGLDVVMTEMNIQPSNTYDPRIETMLYPTFWALAYYHYIHQNVEAAVYFEQGSRIWGLWYTQPRPTFYLVKLLRHVAKVEGSRWLKVSGEADDLKVLGLLSDDQLSVVLINDTTKNVKYDVGVAVNNVKGLVGFDVYQLRDDNQTKVTTPIGKVAANGARVSCPPYSVTVLKARVPKQVVPKTFVEEPSSETMGFTASGQYSFSGVKAEFCKAPRAVKVDGDLAEFAVCKPVSIDGTHFSSGEKSSWKGPSDSSAVARVLYDKDNLYFAVEVKDDKLVFSKEWPWEGDTIELFLGTAYNHRSREEKGDYDYQILLAIDGGKFRPGKPIIQFLGGQGQGTRDAEAKDSEIAAKPVPGGYVVEARIARRNFFELGELKAGMEMRFDIGVDDADDAVQKRKTQIMWNASDAAVWSSPDLWGTAVLK